ncbi:PAS domain S-box protein [Sideroxydans sp. CL21]|uniref:PAS domain S-box protein n=1 Tax=Sideroxydans sp. CL21 TaxID=2600596 RepID=UPI0024BD3773|nr:PAS domain S-box protein [Sideroxydans sp. CL21]
MSKSTAPPITLNPDGATESITELKRQKTLLKTGALQNAILNSANFSRIATDEKGVIQIFNVGAEHMLGYLAADVLNKITPADISDPHEVILRAQALSAELGVQITPGFEALVFKASRGIEDIYELTYIRKDGSRFPAVVSVTALRDANDGIIGYLLIGTDNSARKQVEAERLHLLEIQEETNKQLQLTNTTLQVSEERLAVTLNSIGDAVIATDAEGRVTLMNPLAAQLTGWTQTEANGRPVGEIFYIINQGTRQPAAIPIMETLAHGTIQGLANHTLLIARGGNECAIADSCAPIRDRDGRVIGAVLVFRDVTGEYEVQQTLEAQQVELELQNEELRTSQEALHISQERYVDLYDFAPVSYCTVSEQGQILEANLTTSTLLGLPRSELVKQSISRFIFKEDADIYYLLHKKLSKTGEPQKCELRMVNNGAQIWVQLSATASQDKGVPVLRIVMNNINERKQAEEELFKAGALQRAIFDSANFSSIATDAKGVIQIFNVGAERMLGYAAADVMNKITPADISDPKEVIVRAKTLSEELGTPIAPGFEALVFKASRGIEDIYELTYIRKDASRFPAVVSVTALRDDENSIIGYLLIGTDNTARKQAEEALLKAGALQKAIFDSANFSSIATDAKGVIQIFNVGAERMLGYAAIEVMNKITPADISDPKEVIARAKTLSAELGTQIAPGFEALVFKASRGIEDIYELTYIRKDGSRFPAVVSVTALRDDENSIIGYLLIGTDNTARKQIEEEQKKLDQRLRDQQFYTRSLIESNIDAIITTDPHGIISDVNKQMEALTGCTRDELIGAPFKNYFTDPERAEAAIKQVLNEKKVTNYELTASARDGKETVVSYNATTFYDRDRRLQGVFAAARDVTERKRLDRELENAKSVAEKANLAKSDFLSSMSHELRTPLNAMLGFAQLLESSSPPPTSAQLVRLQQIIKAGWYLLELINEILDLALIESGKLSLSREPVSLIDIILECKAMIEPQAQQRNIQLTFPRFDVPYFVRADQTRLKQIIINLLSNAIKYNREWGTVVVECAESTPERIRIGIKDSGIGLPPEKMEQLFQPFNRLGQEHGVEEGTGIGLVVTKQLVELMGGTIGVESTLGVGSEFWIELVRDAVPQSAAENTPAAEFAFKNTHPAELAPKVPESAAQHTLLYVEDNPANLMLVEQIIENHPHVSMLSARDGNLGIALARARLPDVILMDINLPGINGFEALKILRSDPITMHIPIIALSANAMPSDIDKGLEAGFFRYLTKPIKIHEFMNALDDALEFADNGVPSE